MRCDAMHGESRGPRPVNLRAGRINPLVLVLIVGGVAAAGLIALLPGGTKTSSGTGQRPLVMLVAAGIRGPVEQILERYELEYGVQVTPQYGGSNMLLNQLKVNKFEEPDLYLAADAFYADEAVREGLAAERIPLAIQYPVVAYRPDRKQRPGSWKELFGEGTVWSLPDPDQAASGRATRLALGDVDPVAEGGGSLWDELVSQTTDSGVFKPTVNETANDLKIGAADFGIVWNATVAAPEYRDELAAVPLSELVETRDIRLSGDQVTLAVLTTSTQATAALRLARYFGARDRGLSLFDAAGMEPVEGDVWAEVPEVTFYCGAVNRKAIEPVIDAFQQREGVVINTVFDGCGILTGRMAAIEGQSQEAGFPDVYMACDRYYLDNVNQWFQDDIDVSETEIVLVVPAGSDQVRRLEDLVEPGVRVSIGEPDQCTIGALTRRLLRQAGLYERLKEKQMEAGEVVVEKSSSALIVPDVLTGHVDVAVAYRNDVLGHQDAVDVIRIDSPLTRAIQPLSIARNSDHKRLLRRLYRHVEAAQDRFEGAGFEFLLSGPAGTL